MVDPIAQSTEAAKTNLIRLSRKDNVDITAQVIPPNGAYILNDRERVASQLIPLGFKIANQSVQIGEKIIKHGVSIGTAVQPIDEGELVHTHNLKSDYLPTYLIGSDCSYLEVK